jgi:splicing factor 3A subunit 1
MEGASPNEITKSLPGGANMIIPPLEIKNIIEKTAGYVVRNGASFEERVKTSNAGNQKFSFLRADDEYRPYFEWRVKEIREGRGTDVAEGREGENAATRQAEKPKGPPEPPAFTFSARMPTINAQDLEVILLTALYTAQNGRPWMTQLVQREKGNPQFDFLYPQHSLYQYFSRLVDQYELLVKINTADGKKANEERIAELRNNVSDKYRNVALAKQRAEWMTYQERQKQKKEDAAEAERLAYAQVDWHDFVVVDTVTFDEVDELTELAAPMSLADIQSASLEQKGFDLINANMRIEEAVPGEMMDTYVAPPPPAQIATPTPAYLPHSPGMAQTDYGVQGHGQETEEEQSIRERAEARERAAQAHAMAKGTTGPMRIRNDYVPRAQHKKMGQNVAICPNCNQPIPYDELENHMRIEMLDPQWKEQKAKTDARYSTTNLSTVDIANNLKRLASQRTDVFDTTTGQPVSEEELARRKKAATSYDGHPETRDAHRMSNMNVEEQLKHLQQKFGSK